VTVGHWKKEIQDQAKKLFEGNRGPKPIVAHSDPERLFSEIGRRKVELDWLKKSLGSVGHNPPSLSEQRGGVPISRQCVLAGVCRATIYRRQISRQLDESNLLFRHLIDKEYMRHPFFGSRKMVVFQ
jgi:hypothetical protein